MTAHCNRCDCSQCLGYAPITDTGGRWWAMNHASLEPKAKARKAAAARQWFTNREAEKRQPIGALSDAELNALSRRAP